ncbi:MAG: hypothetical protein JO022_17820, partial [Acidobacteriaceae bacterium]|nr:hypothetical protein [Acidobacteriaceae bacterium]
GEISIDGGRRQLNPAAFRPSPAQRQGNLGRNALTGPAFYSLDLSLARSFALRSRSERVFTIRADAFNILNHANLGNPYAALGPSNFGDALYGRTGIASSFPALIPLSETARQIQIMFRFQF